MTRRAPACPGTTTTSRGDLPSSVCRLRTSSAASSRAGALRAWEGRAADWRIGWVLGEGVGALLRPRRLLREARAPQSPRAVRERQARRAHRGSGLPLRLRPTSALARGDGVRRGGDCATVGGDCTGILPAAAPVAIRLPMCIPAARWVRGYRCPERPGSLCPPPRRTRRVGNAPRREVQSIRTSLTRETARPGSPRGTCDHRRDDGFDI
jgi:hypothetical protein